MKARLLYRANVVRAMVEAIAPLLPVASMSIDANGLKIKAMDAAHISLVSLDLPRTAFETLDGEATIAIAVPDLLHALQCAQPQDVVSLVLPKDVVDEDDKVHHAHQLTILFENARRPAQFKVLLQSIDVEIMNIPDVEYDVVFDIRSSEMLSVCKKLKEFALTAVTIKASPDSIRFCIVSPDLTGNIVYRSGDEEVKIVRCKGDLEMSFALRYLILFCKGGHCAPFARVKLMHDYPMHFEYKLEDYGGSIGFFLAPTRENE